MFSDSNDRSRCTILMVAHYPHCPPFSLYRPVPASESCCALITIPVRHEIGLVGFIVDVLSLTDLFVWPGYTTASIKDKSRMRLKIMKSNSNNDWFVIEQLCRMILILFFPQAWTCEWPILLASLTFQISFGWINTNTHKLALHVF